MNQKKILTITALIITVLLALVAIFTAFKLYNIGKEPVSSPKPKKGEKTPEVFQQDLLPCQLEFTVPNPICQEICNPEIIDQCPDGLVCQPVGYCQNDRSPCENDTDCSVIGDYLCIFENYCINQECPYDPDCVCPEESPSPSPSISPSPSPSGSPSPSPEESPSPSPSENPSPSPSAGSFSPASPLPSRTPSPTPIAGASLPPRSQAPTPAEQLPEAGIVSPTILLSIGGIILIALGLLL